MDPSGIHSHCSHCWGRAWQHTLRREPDEQQMAKTGKRMGNECTPVGTPTRPPATSRASYIAALHRHRLGLWSTTPGVAQGWDICPRAVCRPASPPSASVPAASLSEPGVWRGGCREDASAGRERRSARGERRSRRCGCLRECRARALESTVVR